jgi:hypothetical protein
MSAPNSLVAVFETDGRALEAARRVRDLGVDEHNIRVGDSLDADAFARPAMRRRRPRRLRRAPRPPRSAARRTTLAVPDSAAARRVLSTSASLRVDLVSADGESVATLAANDPGLRP